MRYFVLLLTVILMVACTNDPTSSDLQVDDVTLNKLETTGEAGGESAALVDEIENDIETIEDLDMVQLEGMDGFSLKTFSDNMINTVEFYRNAELSFNKTDSVLYDATISLPLGGTRHIWITWDTETHLGYIYEVSDYKESNIRALAWDSTLTVLDMGPDPYNFYDDVFKSRYEYRFYKEDYHLESFEASFILNEVSEKGRPIDFDAAMIQTFRSFSPLKSIVHQISRNSDKSGRLYRKVTASDDTFWELERIYNGDGTGSFSKTLPNGVTITGTFNILRDDNEGGFTRNVTFPDGFKFSQINVEALFTYTPETFTLSGTITKVYTHSDGNVDTIVVDISRIFDPANDHTPLTTDIIVESTFGVSSEISIIHADGTAHLEGWWITAKGHYATLIGDKYFGDFSILAIEIYESKAAYEADGDPLATALFETMADGSGTATITIDGETYTFEYYASGRGILKKLGRIISRLDFRI